MIHLWIHLVLMLIIILIASQLFTNALEHFAHKIGISAGVTGSILAAIATALPEATVPVVALLAGTPNKLLNEDISVGAILGAPLMLSTLSTFLMAVSVIGQRGFGGRIKPEQRGFVRDLDFFLVSLSLAVIAMYMPLNQLYLREGISFVLIMIYVVYIKQTLSASKQLVKDGYGVIVDAPMLLTKIGFKNNIAGILVQIVLGLGLLIFGAKGFIADVHGISSALNISALLLSILIVPIATELPEKVNSIIWARQNKDTLAFGNITGAMVFQGTLLPALGILLTPWQPDIELLMGVYITFMAAAWLRLNASSRGLAISLMMGNGILYLLYLFLVFY